MRYIVYVFVAVFLGYASEWAPFYVSLFSAQGQISYLGHLSNFETKCSVQGKSKAECTNQYVIPKNIIGSLVEDSAIGVGVILSASQFFCSDNMDKPISVYDDPTNPGRSSTENMFRLWRYDKGIFSGHA